MNYEFLRNADVEVTKTRDEKSRDVALITIDDKYQHRFDYKSRVSKSLDLMTPEDLAGRLTGGSYFFVGDNLYDFRDGFYGGFEQTDETIAHLNDLLGIRDTGRGGMRVHENVTSRHVKLGCKWSNNPITIDAFKDGGEFESELHYGWSPFLKTINSAFMLNRLICTNGMRGLRSFMNTKIPLVNRWDEHLNIANIQIQNKVESITQRRFEQMATERASVAELLVLTDHAGQRIRAGENKFAADNERLRNIKYIADPRNHLNNVYQSHMFKKNATSAQYPGHLTTMDAYNIAQMT